MSNGFEVYLRGIESQLSEHGHHVQWILVGRYVRHGACLGCGMSVVVVHENGFFRARGAALEHPCSPGSRA